MGADVITCIPVVIRARKEMVCAQKNERQEKRKSMYRNDTPAVPKLYRIFFFLRERNERWTDT